MKKKIYYGLAVYDQKESLNLNTEQATLLDKKYKSFSRNGANLSEDKKIQLSFNVLQELAYLESTGLLSEQDLGGALKSVFGGFFGNATQTFVEPILKKFIVPLFIDSPSSPFPKESRYVKTAVLGLIVYKISGLSAPSPVTP